MFSRFPKNQSAIGVYVAEDFQCGFIQGRNKGAMMKNALLFAFLCLFCAEENGILGSAEAQQPSSAGEKEKKEPVQLPAYHNLRYEEDWSVLRGVDGSSPSKNPLKFIPLNEKETVFLSIGGQARGRLETWSNFGFGGPGSRDDTFGLLRLRFHGNLVAGRHLRLFAEGKSALATGRDLPGGLRTLDVDTIDLQNAFLDFNVPFQDGSFTVRTGRQELQFGKQRLVSPLDWANTRRTFDGFRGILKQGNWRIDGFWTRFVRIQKYSFNQNDSGSDLFGLYALGKLPAKLAVDLYWLGLERNQSVWSGVSGEELRHTLGARLDGPISDTPLDFDLETAYQFGDHASRDIRAFMFASQMGYRLSDLPGAPRLTFGFDYASGDEDPLDARVNTFNQLFPLAHAYLGFIDIVGRQNIIALTPGLSLKPLNPLTLRFDLHFFWRADLNDAFYHAGGGIVRPADPLLSRRLGSEMDWTVQYRLNRHTVFTFGYSHFFPGPFIEESGSAEGIHFAYIMIQYTF
jgi:hypothetical protein